MTVRSHVYFLGIAKFEGLLPQCATPTKKKSLYSRKNRLGECCVQPGGSKFKFVTCSVLLNTGVVSSQSKLSSWVRARPNDPKTFSDIKPSLEREPQNPLQIHQWAAEAAKIQSWDIQQAWWQCQPPRHNWELLTYIILTYKNTFQYHYYFYYETN